MTCENCGTEVHGELVVLESVNEPVVSIVSTPDRDWIICDACNAMRCHACCRYPESGYCDRCIEEYHLYDSLVEKGLIQRRT